MNRSARIAALRTRIARRDQDTHAPWPRVCLGAQALDAALGQGAIAVGAVHEVLPHAYGDLPAALGFGVGLLSRLTPVRSGPLVFVSTSYQQNEAGMLYPAGLGGYGINPGRIIHVQVPKPENVLWTIEESLAEPGISAVIGMLPTREHAYDFTASRRLALRAARHGVTAILVPARSQMGTATAAEMRWSVAAEPGTGIRYRGHYLPGMGAARWRATILKSRKGFTGHWSLEWDHEALCFRVAAPMGNRTPIRHVGAEQGQRALP